MPAYWLRLLPAAASAPEAELLKRFYYPATKPKPQQEADYDQRLVMRVGSEQASVAVVDFALHYFQSMGHKYTSRSIWTVGERMVRGWELAGRPGTQVGAGTVRVSDAGPEIAATAADRMHGLPPQIPPPEAHPAPFTLVEREAIAATIQKIHLACDTSTQLVLDLAEARLLRRLLAIHSGAFSK